MQSNQDRLPEDVEEALMSVKEALDSSPEPKHKRAYFAGQQWVSEELHQKELSQQKTELLKLCREAGINSCKPVVNLDNPEDNCEICGYSHKYKNENNAVYYDSAHEKHELLNWFEEIVGKDEEYV